MPLNRPADFADPPWLSLVLDEGQPAITAGLLLHVRGQPRLVADGGFVAGMNRDVATTMTVPLRLAGSGPSLDSYDETQVTVRGTLHNGSLVIRSADDLHPRPDPPDADALPRLPTADSPKARRPRPSIRLADERVLMERGTLLDAWTDHQSNRRIALATDPGEVTDVLAKHYGEQLDVVQSQWGAETFDRIRATIDAVDDNLLRSWGNDIGPDHQMRISMTLLHLPSRLSERLAAHPVGALTMNVLVKPG